jgi:hypothetical protein
MAKNIDYYASVINGSSRVIGESQNDWNTVREGSYIKFQTDSTYFTVSGKKEFFFISNFINQDKKGVLLELENDCGIDIMRRDVVTITFKEMELVNLSSITKPGEGYAIGDVVQSVGGEYSVNPQDNAPKPAMLKVTEIDGKGGIKSLNIESRGKYLKAPPDEISLVQGNGSNAEAKVSWGQSVERHIVEKEVEDVITSNGTSTIALNYPLPMGVTEGKLSVKKWELYLSSPYNCGGKIATICNITRDFTPNFNLPLMSDNQHPWLLNQEVAHNESVSRLDLILKGLEERIKKLEEPTEKDV